jgi:hypothetical protein
MVILVVYSIKLKAHPMIFKVQHPFWEIHMPFTIQVFDVPLPTFQELNLVHFIMIIFGVNLFLLLLVSPHSILYELIPIHLKYSFTFHHQN